MSWILALALLDGLPTRLADREEIFGVEAFVLTTSWDEGIHVDDAPGFGVDFNFRWRWNEKTRFGFSVGAAFWDPETDVDALPDQDVDVVQYRAGVGAEFPFGKAVEVGVGVTTGVYRFRTRGDHDTSPFVEFEGSLGFRPIPALKIGGLVMATHTQSSFSRSHTHLFHNYSAGLMVELSF
jgi:hypothetical protein